jgi:hypothetical protein
MMEVKTGELTIKPENRVEKIPEVAAKKPMKKTSGEKALLTFKENRKYDLHLGRKIITFMARETKPVLKSLLIGLDWKQASKLFIVKSKEVKE